ncbi:MAG TPA: hypothetical protein VFH99_04275 [Candidatus Saccharimonadales bacterium]|nr:hypothetical protein [Candidatus Saccharimonadales bacterium]
MPNGTQRTRWAGWVYFAGVLLILRGISQAFLGITALVNKHYLFTTANNTLVVSTNNMNAWGWVDLAVGLLVLAVGFSVLHGSAWARVVAVFLAGVSFLVNMAFLGIFPVWAIVAMIVDAWIIYALVVHSDEVV